MLRRRNAAVAESTPNPTQVYELSAPNAAGDRVSNLTFVNKIGALAVASGNGERERNVSWRDLPPGQKSRSA